MRARRVFCLLLAVILLAALLPQALAAGLIETNRPVTLTVRFFHDKAPVSGAPFSLYRVADVSAYGEFTLTGDFKDDPVRLDDRSSDGWRALAETLRAFVLRDSRKPLAPSPAASRCHVVFCAHDLLHPRQERGAATLPGLAGILERGGADLPAPTAPVLRPSRLRCTGAGKKAHGGLYYACVWYPGRGGHSR